jgi:hypothetical protein
VQVFILRKLKSIHLGSVHYKSDSFAPLARAENMEHTFLNAREWNLASIPFEIKAAGNSLIQQKQFFGENQDTFSELHRTEHRKLARASRALPQLRSGWLEVI